ncbi:MAG: ATP-binding protein [Actinomycetota bacterium]
MVRRSFAFRLTAAFVGVGIASAAVAALLVNAEFGRRFANYLDDRQLSQEQQVAAALAEAYGRTSDWSTADLSPAGALIAMEGGTLEVRDPSGSTVWVADASTTGIDPAIHRAMMGAGPLGPELSLPIEVQGNVVGYAAMRLPAGGLLPHDVSFRDAVNRLLIIGGVAAAAVALLLGLVLSRRAVAPAGELTAAARAFAGGNRTTRISSGRDDEFGEMADAFDAMADTVDEEDELRRTFASDVAHELRTPLAILRTSVESMQDGVVAADAGSIASLHEEVLRMSRLVEDLETLAQADAARFSLRREPLDLGAEVRTVAAGFRDRFAERGIDLRDPIADARIEGDADRIRQIVANLLTNALKFTPPGGSVTVSVTERSGTAVLEVWDTGPGIPADEIDLVFDRFYRGRTVRAGGSGIGLAVVRDLARAHGGDVSVQSEPAGGSRFRVVLPSTSRSGGSFTTPSHPASTVGVEGGDQR